VTRSVNGMRRALVCAAILCSLSIAGASALPLTGSVGVEVSLLADTGSDPVEGLFDHPPEDTTAPESSVDLVASAQKEKGIRITGRYEAAAGGSAGWVTVPDFANLAAGLDAAVGFSTTTYLYLDARPDPSFRVFCGLSAGLGVPRTDEDRVSVLGELSVPSALLSGSAIVVNPALAIDELYCDYTLGDLVFFRAGRSKFAWGQGRLFTPGNLVSSSSEGISLRIGLPTVLSGSSLVAITDSTLVASEPPLSQLGFGGKADAVLGPVLATAAGYFKQEEGARILASLKTVVLGVDLFGDAVCHVGTSFVRFQCVAGFFWEAKGGSVRIYGEYQYDGETVGGMDHSFALAVGLRSMFGSRIDGGLSWFHTFQDGSGSVLVGVRVRPFPLVAVDVGVPFAYGPDGGRYVSTSYNQDSALMSRLALAVKVTLSGDF
jgi:hypothetical protein